MTQRVASTRWVGIRVDDCKVTEPVFDGVPEAMQGRAGESKKMSRDVKVLRVLAILEPSRSYEEISGATGFSGQTLANILSYLRRRGYAERINQSVFLGDAMFYCRTQAGNERLEMAYKREQAVLQDWPEDSAGTMTLVQHAIHAQPVLAKVWGASPACP
ncbi:hypothetical protein [Variovorax sp. GB1P17]|uniref:hypothetical protein n=1 Tax=Variovorax sp. GB1P17 TaxID=3443740 RepID=UPI003F448494